MNFDFFKNDLQIIKELTMIQSYTIFYMYDFISWKFFLMAYYKYVCKLQF